MQNDVIPHKYVADGNKCLQDMLFIIEEDLEGDSCMQTCTNFVLCATILTFGDLSGRKIVNIRLFN